MHISLDWVGQYVDIADLPPDTIAERLTMSTAEVEGVHPLTRTLAGVRIARVETVEPLDGAQTFVTVACGAERMTTVCGAPNVRVGMTSAFAPAGMTLADGRTIAERRVGGRSSRGVLCSSDELGMGGGHFGILDLPDGLEPGRPLADLVPATDTLFEIDNKSITHRPDLWGHYGIAREVAAIFERPLRPLPCAELTAYNDLPAYPLTVDDADNCPCYGCIELDGVAPSPSPLALQTRLHTLGQRTFNVLVDLTNYVMLELGQPMHAFDASRLRAVRVAPFGTHGRFTTLDGQDREMRPDDLMIWNERAPVALAGIMGGLNSEVGPATTCLLLESANFKDARIRRTATRLGVHTDASQRFEKQQPPANTRMSIARFLHLLGEAGLAVRPNTRFTYRGELQDRTRRLDVPVEFFDRRIGNPIAADRIVSILTGLGFDARAADGVVSVGIPPFRSAKDISLPVDILEEVTRIHGYDNLEPVMSGVAVGTPAFNDRLRAQHKARRLLAQAHGFSEVHTYSWFDETWLRTLGFEPDATLEMANSSAEHNVRLQTTLIPNVLNAVKKNAALRDRFRIFELGRIYLPAGDHDRTERNVLAGASCQQDRHGSLEDHFRCVKGALEDMAGQLGVRGLAVVSAAEGSRPWQAAGCVADVRLAGAAVGQLGFLANPILAEVAPAAQVVWFELDFDRFEGPIYPNVGYAPASRYPGSWFDFSIVADVSEGFAELAGRLDEFSHPLLKKREFVTIYQGKGLDPGLGSYTFRYWIESPDGTLSGAQIDAFRAEFLDFLRAKGLRLRT